MDMKPTALLVSAIIALSAQPAESAQPDEKEAGYLEPIQQELSRLSITFRCDQVTSTCTFTDTNNGEAPPFVLTVRYSGQTQTVYIAIEKYLACDSQEGPAQPLAVRLLHLNRRLVTTKLEWDETTAHIRISTVLSTDSNFDRKAFRSQLKALLFSAITLRDDLQALATECH